MNQLLASANDDLDRFFRSGPAGQVGQKLDAGVGPVTAAIHVIDPTFPASTHWCDLVENLSHWLDGNHSRMPVTDHTPTPPFDLILGFLTTYLQLLECFFRKGAHRGRSRLNGYFLQKFGKFIVEDRNHGSVFVGWTPVNGPVLTGFCSWLCVSPGTPNRVHVIYSPKCIDTKHPHDACKERAYERIFAHETGHGREHLPAFLAAINAANGGVWHSSTAGQESEAWFYAEALKTLIYARVAEAQRLLYQVDEVWHTP